MIETSRGAGPRSNAAFERARSCLAQGVDSPVRAGAPMGAAPPVLASAGGSRVVDVDGREYIDYLCAYGPVLLGHGEKSIAQAIERAAHSGSVTGVTHPEEVRLAERLSRAIPSMQRLRFVSTGTEACMSAVRTARAYTRREKIVRFAGNYHGHSDDLLFSAGASSNEPPGIASGITSASSANVVIVPYNDLIAAERTLDAMAGEVAAIIVEPVCANMGLVLPRPGYLQGLRAAATRSGSLLIFDEVITGFRLGLGGYQARCGVTPDLTCVGKALGGGAPIAAFGGREDVMAVLAPGGPVFQGGTFSGNPLCAAAAHALLDRLESDATLYDRLDRLAGALAAGLQRAIDAKGLGYSVVQLGSIVDFMFRRGAPHADYREACEADGSSYARYYWTMLAHGIHLAPSRMEVMFVTAAHNQADIDATIAAAERSL
jgi:glutamate-1-semialdehyde 2,1-aminomutase